MTNEEIKKTFIKKKGLSYSDEYKIFHAIKSRCNNSNNHAYKYYGGRGIKCLYVDVESFISDVGLRPTKAHSIDRINNSKSYQVGNCRWATMKQQTRNKRNNIKFNGEVASDADIRLKGGNALICKRLKRGWSKKAAFTAVSKTNNRLRFKNELIKDACKRLGGNNFLIYDRLKSGWSIAKAFTTPKR